LIATVGKIYEQRKEQVLAQIARLAQRRTAAYFAYCDEMKPVINISYFIYYFKNIFLLGLSP
jgi:hypothetical protein